MKNLEFRVSGDDFNLDEIETLYTTLGDLVSMSGESSDDMEMDYEDELDDNGEYGVTLSGLSDNALDMVEDMVFESILMEDAGNLNKILSNEYLAYGFKGAMRISKRIKGCNTTLYKSIGRASDVTSTSAKTAAAAYREFMKDEAAIMVAYLAGEPVLAAFCINMVNKEVYKPRIELRIDDDAIENTLKTDEARIFSHWYHSNVYGKDLHVNALYGVLNQFNKAIKSADLKMDSAVEFQVFSIDKERLAKAAERQAARAGRPVGTRGEDQSTKRNRQDIAGAYRFALSKRLKAFKADKLKEMDPNELLNLLRSQKVENFKINDIIYSLDKYSISSMNSAINYIIQYGDDGGTWSRTKDMYLTYSASNRDLSNNYQQLADELSAKGASDEERKEVFKKFAEETIEYIKVMFELDGLNLKPIAIQLLNTRGKVIK